MAGPSQPQVTDEVWDDDRVKSFLNMGAYVGKTYVGKTYVGKTYVGNADFHVLMRAYRGMRPSDFERFLQFFVDANRNLDATDDKGRTFWSIIEGHRQGADFLALRKKR